tara:strand:- start:501 stop:1283 length:783 start_codon:yes stop_codon:yes gene_type:complete
MAINVNTVYTTVLSILNKEQRGYLTPYEFNQAATQVQLDIFENYFKNLDKQLRIPQNEFDYSNPIENIDDELSTFKCLGSCAYQSSLRFILPTVDSLTSTDIVYDDAPAANEFAFYRLGTVTFGSNKPVEVERLQRDYFYNIDRSDLTAPSVNYPVYLYENKELTIKPGGASGITANVEASFIRKPKNVVWAYSVNSSLGNYVYQPSSTGTGIIPTTGSVDFEISSNYQTEVILEILKYAGVVIRDPQIVQAAAQELADK